MIDADETSRGGFDHGFSPRAKYVELEVSVSRLMATKCLDTLAASGFLNKQRIGRNNYYMNQRLVALFVDGAA